MRASALLALLGVLAACASGCTSAVGSRAEPGASTGASVAPTRLPGSDDPSLEGAGLPTLAPPEVLTRVPTRVRLPKLGIDLAVVPPDLTPGVFPACNVAEYLPILARPGRPGATFIYAHARPGMFLPILEASRVDRGRSLIGQTIHVFTSDDRRFTYEVTEVLRHVDTLDFAYRITTEQLLLQTSEGPVGTPGKTFLIAEPRGEEAAAPQVARPKAEPVRCD